MWGGFSESYMWDNEKSVNGHSPLSVYHGGRRRRGKARMTMTRRERLELKLEKRREWAEKATARSQTAYARAQQILDRIPLGQPILVGHHSERRHRRDLSRIDRAIATSLEESKLASHHTSKAAGIEHALDVSIFDDDPDAIQRLHERIAENEKRAQLLNACNKAWRASGIEGVRAIGGDDMARNAEETMRLCPWLRAPFDATNLRAAIRRDKERIDRIEAQRARVREAAASPGGVRIDRIEAQRARVREAAASPGGVRIVESGDYVCVTFAQKPAREVIASLKEAGFWWGQGSWTGPKEKLPTCVSELRGMGCHE
jgi:hypothetical protein